ncbi:stalk domain-containing protein [Ammoniphilus sp. CFH 90114]|uniref:stalk domain-containing protein n=1 Tax=Ammoniphilus sp. CFH 90114 TaxID=2493665 RepID=UPI00100FB371|nr:stalk domain-containing protein [Ammoniphilus sp. CFH 90114]RXT04545.1 hypothetical protein EIZ39_20235 [Ammoniphilus sp. CFH 90114]
MSKGLRVRDFVSGVMVGAILFSGVAYAASTKIDVSFKPIKFFFEGEEKIAGSGEQGFVYNGRTYVPLRFMGESLGKEVTYYQGI